MESKIAELILFALVLAYVASVIIVLIQLAN
jgi:hypothetical protein